MGELLNGEMPITLAEAKDLKIGGGASTYKYGHAVLWASRRRLRDYYTGHIKISGR